MLRALLSLILIVALGVGSFFAWPYLLPTERDAVAGRGDRQVPVVVSEVTRRPFEDVLEALGTVRSNESVVIVANASDQIESLHFQDGEEVEAGQLLVQLDTAEEQARLAEAMALRDDRKNRYAQLAELFKREMSSQGDLDNQAALLRAAEARVTSLEAQIADRRISAPFGGTLGFRAVSQGAMLSPDTMITTLDDLSTVKLDFTIPETWLSWVRPGMEIAAVSDALPGRRFVGAVATLETRIDEQTRAVTVRAALPNEDRALRPGMLLKLRVVRSREEAVVIPEACLIPDQRRQFVYLVDRETGVVEEREVVLGRRRRGDAEITAGLEGSELVIVEGMIRVRAGDRVTWSLEADMVSPVSGQR